MLVKRQEDRPANTSKAYFKFDIHSLSKSINDARFLVYKAGKYDNGEVILYALKKGYDNWSESSLTWNNSAQFGNDINSHWAMDNSKVDSLGIFKVNKTNNSEKVVYQGVDFTNYIESRRLAGDVNLTIVLATKWVNSNGDAVLQISSKESTGVLKPTLQVIYGRNASVAQNMRFFPENITLLPNQQRKFYANLFDQYGSIMDSPVTFSVNNGGTISSEGVFHASAPGVYTLTAQSEGITATTTVTIDTSTRLKSATADSYNLIVVDKNATILSADKLPFDVSILNVDGKLLQRSTNNYLKSEMQLNYPAGIYFVQIRSAVKSITKKIIVY